MNAITRVEMLRAQVETLWQEVQTAPESLREDIRLRYQEAYAAYHRQKEWCDEMEKGVEQAKSSQAVRLGNSMTKSV